MGILRRLALTPKNLQRHGRLAPSKGHILNLRKRII
jgi:hypothetical protein